MKQSVLYHLLLRSSQELPADYDRVRVGCIAKHICIERNCLVKAHLLPCLGVFPERLLESLPST